MAPRFGTDGLRGRAGSELTAELALALGRAAARHLHGRVVIGRDTRESGPMLEAALAAGLASAGADVELLGVVPTPAVAHVAAVEGIAGAVISASHNAYRDNGIKLFGVGGRKLGDDAERAIEADLDAVLRGDSGGAERFGSIGDHPRGRAAYVERLLAVGPDLGGLTVVLDAGNGAAHEIGPEVLARLGASVHVVGAAPDGRNINDGCGATAPSLLAATVVEVGADAGIGLDGDADRCIAVAHDGSLVDGDHLLAICALDRHERGALAGDALVVTVMANLGLRQAMENRSIRVVETPVGDRYVLEALERDGLVLGGEQSGHVIFRELATTGDGILTALQVLDVVQRTGRPLADLAVSSMTRLPQVLVNVALERQPLDVMAAIAADIDAASARLGSTGRVLVRPSGTEPVVRVMVEAPDAHLAHEVADALAAAVRRVGASTLT